MKFIRLIELLAPSAVLAADHKLIRRSFFNQEKYAEALKRTFETNLIPEVNLPAQNSNNNNVVGQTVNCNPFTEEYCYDDKGEASCAIIADGGCVCNDGEVKCGGDQFWTGFCTTLCCDALQETCYDDDGSPSYCADMESGGCPCREGEKKCGSEFGWAGYCSPICCDVFSQEICYSDGDNPTSCANFTDGGCPCKEGEVKCGGDGFSWSGYCTTLCCDYRTEETCYDVNGEPSFCALYSEGGCPCKEDEVKCGASYGYTGYCAKLCCEDYTEETCYSNVTWEAESCALIEEGGCPCPEGQIKCGAYPGFAGYCAPFCCEDYIEETCYSAFGIAESCALIEDGGCPCPDGQLKCGSFPGYAGYCASVCCDDSLEETCYSVMGQVESCAPIADGGCPCPAGQIKCGSTIGYAGYCASMCCEDYVEETCYSMFTGQVESCALIVNGGCPCPSGQVKCGASLGYAGYCTDLCCQDGLEELCYSPYTGFAESCALISEGGCPCPDGQVKCGGSIGNPGYCTSICCEDFVEETCYSQFTGQPDSCASIADGGCPCPDGQVKCGASPGYAGYCAPVCCKDFVEETCYSEFTGLAQSCALIEDGGCPCPDGQIKCGASKGYAGFCTHLCCEDYVEETCYSQSTGQAESCAKFSDGGCPCPEGQIKCGAVGGYPGYCTDVCCDPWTEETCYSQYTGQPETCSSLADGGCPCPEGQVKCGAVDGYPGYCTSLCCDQSIEETCNDPFSGELKSCALITDGGCPCPEGLVKCGVVEGRSGYCTQVCCDENTEETCYSRITGNAESCALLSEGGCPCAEGEIKCEGHDNKIGYCAKVCCDESIEETCFSIFTGEADSCALITDGGCPCADGEIKCGVTDAYSGYCTSVCCDDLIEETCFSEYTGLAESCALITDGGCPCPYGMKKCGATEAHAGYCASVCCGDGEEVCYNMNGYQYCADYASGGCPCWPGEMKCGANETYPGYCSSLCCEENQENCWDVVGNEYCAQTSRGGCRMNAFPYNSPISFGQATSYHESNVDSGNGSDHVLASSATSNVSLSSKPFKQPLPSSHAPFSKSSKIHSSANYRPFQNGGKSAKAHFGKSSSKSAKASSYNKVDASSAKSSKSAHGYAHEKRHRIFKSKWVREDKLFG